MKFCKVVAAPVSTFRSENWAPRKQNSRLSTEIRCLRTKVCKLKDLMRNEDIKTELNIFPMNDTIHQNSLNCRQHIERMKED